MAKVKYIQSSVHAMIGHTGAASDVVGPGNDRVPLDESSDSHKYLVEQIEGKNPDYAHLSIIEIDHEQEGKQAEEREKLLAKGQEIAAKQREEQAQEAIEGEARREELREQAAEEGQPPVNEGTVYPPQDVRAQKLAEESGAGQRASTQDDVADEDKEQQSSRSRRRGGRS